MLPLVKTLLSGSILTGKAAVVFHTVISQYICALFRPWKAVEASEATDITLFGSIKSTAILYMQYHK